MKAIILLVFLSVGAFAIVQNHSSDSYPPSRVSFDDYESLANEVKAIRAHRLIHFDKFLQMQASEKTVVLDTRSRAMFKGNHIEGAINLPFTEFTQQKLYELIPDSDTNILIYCNNNIQYEEINFPDKSFNPSIARTFGFSTKNKYELPTKKKPRIEKEILLALNIPTYINLYGYGYRNIYELDELVSTMDKRLKLTYGH